MHFRIMQSKKMMCSSSSVKLQATPSTDKNESKLMDERHLVVVGGGITGLAAAWEASADPGSG